MLSTIIVYNAIWVAGCLVTVILLLIIFNYFGAFVLIASKLFLIPKLLEAKV